MTMFKRGEESWGRRGARGGRGKGWAQGDKHSETKRNIEEAIAALSSEKGSRGIESLDTEYVASTDP